MKEGGFFPSWSLYFCFLPSGNQSFNQFWSSGCSISLSLVPSP